jgi:hypothetical protein
MNTTILGILVVSLALSIAVAGLLLARRLTSITCVESITLLPDSFTRCLASHML